MKDIGDAHRELRALVGTPELPDGAPVVRVLTTAGLEHYRSSATAVRSNGTWTLEFVDQAWDFRHNRAQPSKLTRTALSAEAGRKLDAELASDALYRQPHTMKAQCMDGANVYLEVLRARRPYQAARICEADGAIARIDAILATAEPPETPLLGP